MTEIPYIENILRLAKQKIADQKLNSAYSEILNGLKKFPYNKPLQKLRVKCEKQIQKQINKRVKVEIETVKKLFDEKKFNEVIKETERIFRYAPHNQKILNLYRNAVDQRSQLIALQNKEFISKKRKELSDEYEKGDEDSFLKTLVDLDKNFGSISGVNELISIYRDKLIERKISEKHDLLLTDKFNAIKNFISTLERIDSENIRVRKIKAIQHSREFGEQISEKSEFVYESMIHIKTLIRLKKYNEALIAVNEVHELAPNYRKATSLKRKIENRLYKITKSIVVKQIRSNKSKLNADYKLNKKKYIVI